MLFSAWSSSRIPFLAVMPATMMIPMNDEMFSVMPLSHSAARLPASDAIAAIRHAIAGARRPNSHTRIRKMTTAPASSTIASWPKAFCCSA